MSFKLGGLVQCDQIGLFLKAKGDKIFLQK